MPDALPVRAGLTIPGDELHETASRAGGPGGQNVQKTSTRVTLIVAPLVSSASGESASPRSRRPRRVCWISRTAAAVTTAARSRT